MIRRDAGNDWLLIAQAAHAHLAAEVARHWGNRRVPALPLSDLLLPAIHDHDEGWHEWERQPEVDAETGRPRDFTEMPMAAATEIWSRSIETSARGAPRHSDALRMVSRQPAGLREPPAGNRAAVLEAALSLHSTFFPEEIVDLLGAEVGRSTVLRVLIQMERSGILRRRMNPLSGQYFEIAVPPTGASPLGGIWVSRHFTWLAEQARESRRGNPDDVAAIDRFLGEQSALGQQWAESAREFAGDELQRVIETGFRYVQFFDRISLWLCCAERAEPAEVPLPGGETFRLIPKEAQAVSIEPYPLSVRELPLRVPCRRIPRRRYADWTALQQTLQAAPLEELRWTVAAHR